MCHKKEIPPLGHSNAAIDDRARVDVAVAFCIGSVLVCWIEAVMMVLANNDKADLRLDCIPKDLGASFSNCGYLLAQNDLVLPFGHA